MIPINSRSKVDKGTEISTHKHTTLKFQTLVIRYGCLTFTREE